jgi:hypothetical protein
VPTQTKQIFGYCPAGDGAACDGLVAADAFVGWTYRCTATVLTTADLASLMLNSP